VVGHKTGGVRESGLVDAMEFGRWGRWLIDMERGAALRAGEL
jgi:hypothetical protein